MMTSDNYSSSHRYKVDKSDGRRYQKETERSERAGYYEDNAVGATDLNNTENVASERRSRGHRRSKDHISADGSTADQADGGSTMAAAADEEGASAPVADKPKSLKKEKASGKKRKDRKNLREKRRSTGVVIMPGAGAANDDVADEARQTMENTMQNESIGTEDDYTGDVPSSTGQNRIGGNEGDRSQQELIERIEQLEKNLELKTKEVETLKAENKRLHDDNNALLRVVNQVSSLKVK